MIPKIKGQISSPAPLTTGGHWLNPRKRHSHHLEKERRSRFYILLTCMRQHNGYMWWAMGIILKIMIILMWRAMSLHAPVPVVTCGWVRSHTLVNMRSTEDVRCRAGSGSCNPRFTCCNAAESLQAWLAEARECKGERERRLERGRRDIMEPWRGADVWQDWN